MATVCNSRHIRYLSCLFFLIPAAGLANAASTKSSDAQSGSRELVAATDTDVATLTAADGKGSWSKGNGTWTFTSKSGQSTTGHPDFQKQTVKQVEKLSDGGVKVVLDNGMVVRDRPDGSRLHYADEADFKANQPSKLICTDASTRSFTWQSGKLATMTATDGTVWYQVSADLWAQTQQANTGWSGKLEIDGVTGSFTRVPLTGTDKDVRDVLRTDGVREKYRPDGSMDFEVKFPDGTTRLFSFKTSFAKGSQELTQPENLKVTTKDGTVSEWKRLTGDQYDIAGTKTNCKFRVSITGEYQFQNLDTGYDVTRRLDGTEETFEKLSDGSTQRKRNGNVIEFQLGEHRVIVTYDDSGNAVRLEHANENRVWKKDSSGWKAEQLKQSEAYAKPKEFEEYIMAHADLEPASKVRMLENWRKFEKNSKFSDQQKKEFKASLKSLLEPNTTAPFTAVERARYADQLLWHVCYLERNEQGGNNTCNVTTLRGLLLANKPELVASIVASVANTGELKTQDGSVIKPPIDSIRPKAGSPEASFPPEFSKRTALGKLWDVVTINVYFQRQTVDEMGYTVGLGNVSYHEIASSSGDTGARIVTTFSNGTKQALGTNTNGVVKPNDSPNMYASRIADVYNQITGETLAGKYLIHSNRGVGNSAVYTKFAGDKVGSVADLEKVLKKKEFPVIVQGNTGILRQRYEQQKALDKGQPTSTVVLTSGGEHVWLVTAYDEATKTVSIDNSWYPGYDFMNSAEAKAKGIDAAKHIDMTLDDLYRSMERSTTGESYTYTYISF